MSEQIAKIKHYYETEKTLVTSPFIDRSGQVNGHLFLSVLKKLSLEIKSGIVLDVGCGTGLLSTLLSNAVTYIGLDLARQRTVYSLRDYDRFFLQGDSHSIPLKSQTVDFLICLDSMEHYPSLEIAAAEFRRVLKDGRILLLSTPTYANIAGWAKRIYEKNGGYMPNTWAPFDYWKTQELELFITPTKIKQTFKKAGFSNFTFIGYENEVSIGLFPWLWHPQMPSKIASLIQKIFNVLAKSIIRIRPESSLHTFWKIL